MDADASLDPQHWPRRRPVVGGRADLVLGARSTGSAAALPVAAALANRVLARRVRRRTGLRLLDLGPMRAARREDLLALDLRPPFRLSGRDRGTGRRRRLAGRRGKRGLPPAAGVEGHRNPLGAWRAVRDLSAAICRRRRACARPATTVFVLAKQPVAGRAKTRLQPAFTPPGGVARRGPLADTQAAVRACRASRRILAWEGDHRPGWDEALLCPGSRPAPERPARGAFAARRGAEARGC